MGITIIHLEGPLAGKEQHFDDSVAEILFGRDREEALVVYPPEYDVVSKKHCQLSRNEVGDYSIALFGDRYVEIDGVPAATQRNKGVRMKTAAAGPNTAAKHTNSSCPGAHRWSRRPLLVSGLVLSTLMPRNRSASLLTPRPRGEI